MIYSIKSTKQKKYKFSSAFTLLELIFIIIIIGILASSLIYNFIPNKLHLAADRLCSIIRYTKSLALKDDKYQPFPKSSSAYDLNQSKYWFKQWWQLKFANDGNDLIYLVFSDKPGTNTSNFDKKIIKSSHKAELARDPEGRYIYGGDTYLYADEKPVIDYNLSYFGIKKVELITDYSYASDGYVHLLFDNLGNVFLDEGKKNDAGDINPLDGVRKQLVTNAKLRLCKKINPSTNRCDTSSDNCIQINITAMGYISKSKCY